MAARYDRGIKRVVHHVGDLAMLYQESAVQLQSRWKGPFRISNYEESHARSFALRQLNTKLIRGRCHDDHLKTFIPRTGFFSDPSDPCLLQQQTIRRRRPRGEHVRTEVLLAMHYGRTWTEDGTEVGYLYESFHLPDYDSDHWHFLPMRFPVRTLSYKPSKVPGWSVMP